MTADPSTVLDAVLTILGANNLSVHDVVAHAKHIGIAPASRPVPTIADYVTKVGAAAAAGVRTTYNTYWRLLVDLHGTQSLDEVTALDLKLVAATAQERALVRRNSVGGTGARELCVAAIRYVFRQAHEDGLIKTDPSALVRKPTRPDNQRRALTSDEMNQVWTVVSSGGNDPKLDTLLVRFFVETGARRGGALALRRRGIRPDTQQVLLSEKGGKQRWQPVSKTLLDALLSHATERGATADDDAVFRYRPRKGELVGRPMTRRRLNTLADRIQAELPWAGQLGVSPHWFRHTATSAVERVAGFAVARAFAGHTGGKDATMTYIKASEEEVATAVAALTGENHPLARKRQS